MQLGWPYPEAPRIGVWGAPTSNHNFCEEDYNITPYLGEFVNTLTNVVYVIYGAYGLRRVRPHKDGGLWSTLAFPYWGLVGVGVLSMWFHATLKYHSQMGDDLSMFLAVGGLLHQLLCFEATLSQRRIYTLVILGILIPVSVYHCWADEIILHEIVFGGMVFVAVRRIRALIKKKIKSEEAREKLGRMATLGISSGLFGFFLWNIDFHLCGYVTAFKHRVGLPLGFLFELHGWWHFFTGVCSYVGMALVEYLVTFDESKTHSEQGFVWPVKGVMRELGLIEKRDMKKET